MLIATDTYHDETFGALRAPHRDAAELATVLSDPAIGAFAAELLLNQPVQRLRERLDGLFAEAVDDDMVLLYLSGHGVKDRTGRLYFATEDTRADRLPSTALSAEFVRQLMDDSLAGRVVLWLDCCFGGAFPVDLSAKGEDVDVVARLSDGRGRSIMTASTAIQFAYEPSGDVRGGTRTSLFTRALIEGLRSGAADLDGDGEITTRELYGYVHDHVRRSMPGQTPTSNDSVVGTLAVARAANRSAGVFVPEVRLTTEPDLGEAAFVRDFLVWQGRIWRVGAWSEEARVQAHGPHAVNRAGTLLAAGGGDDEVAIWETEGHPDTWQEIVVAGGSVPWGTRLSFSHDDTMLALSGDGAPTVWDCRDWTAVGLLPGVLTDASSVVFNPMSPLVVVDSSLVQLTLFDLPGWNASLVRGGAELTFERFSPDGRLGAFHRMRDTVVLDLEDWTTLVEFRHDGGHTRRCAFSPDNRYLVTSSTRGLRVLDAATGKPVQVLAEVGYGCVPVFSPDGRYLVAGLNDGLHVWRFAGG
ncbi:caspase domain-containing protein [Saccharothrix australiensis]|uniref:Caspase domain-containing protein n=1 Tax=Saccharothrix australiensis TaxID=2072 RepID=A0A495W8A9_9PSEU|nr:caspase domain-containing protein [Saccharothrix australiensis]